MDEKKYNREWFVHRNDEGLPIMDTILQSLGYRSRLPDFCATQEGAIAAYRKALDGRLERCQEEMVKLQRESFALDELDRDITPGCDAIEEAL